MAEEVKFQKVDGKSLDIEAVDKEKLKKIFPQCFNEGKLDINKLLSLCGEYIDNDFEKYKFEWKGKSECYRIAGKRSTGTLRPCPKESVDFENTNNLYIEGDNLEVLKLLQTAYYRKVKMIYIDPPYNTGNDFVYEDDFKDPLAKYKEITSQTTKSNPETMGRYHTNWLNMMYPRLRLAANLLRDDGVIFISIDDNEVTNLRRLCDEVFGEENFVAQLVWEKKKKGSFLSNSITNIKEYILVYSKNLFEFNGLIGEINNEIETYPCVNAVNKREIRHIPTGIESKFKEKNYFLPKGYIISDTTMNLVLHSDLVITDGKLSQELIIEGNWRYSQDMMTEYALKGEIYITRDLYLRRTVSDTRYKTLKDLLPRIGDDAKSTYNDEINLNNLFEQGWGSNEDADEELRLLFGVQKLLDYPKPTRLIMKLLASCRDVKDTDIILDFFSGSATTAHAVMQLNAEDGGNRQFIMVQLPELTDEKSEAFKAGYKNICEIGKERIRRAGAKIKAEHPEVDTGFKVLKLDTSNLVKWDDTPTDSEEDLFNRMNSVVKSLKNDRSELDVVFEVMLKLGIPPTYKVNEINVNGRKVYSIGDDGLVLICLDSANGGITPEDISAMCDLAPAKIVAAEEAFKDDIALSNAYYISKDKGIEIELL